MRTTDVVRAFSGSRAAIAEALGISISAVYQWSEIVPPTSALRLREMRPDIPYDAAAYTDWNAKFGRRKRRAKKAKRH